MAAPAGSQSGKPGPTSVVEGEELQFLAELAVVALLRLLQHREVFVELGLVLESGAVNALQLRILLVAFVISARHVRELERADVAGAHDVRTGAEIDELSVAVIARSASPSGMSWMISSLNLLGFRALAKAAKRARFGHARALRSRVTSTFARKVVGLDLLLHLRLDLLEILRRDAMRQIHVVIKAVLDRRPGRELRFRPDLQNGGRQNVGGGMPQPLDIGHLGAFFGSFAIVLHRSNLVDSVRNDKECTTLSGPPLLATR